MSGARLDYDLRVGDANSVIDSLIVTPNDIAPFFIPVIVTSSWQRGSPVLVDLRAIATAVAEAGADSFVQSRVQFGNSLEWDGIQALFDEQGNPVESFTALSPDGVDWATASTVVPLPGAAWLLVSGLSALAGCGALRRRQ